jgi:hypothetical protein
MKFVVSSLVVVAATLGVAQATMAQQAAGSEADYCRMLARTYLSQNPVQSTPSVADATLADGCTTDAQATTALLKRKLADHGIDLPKPSTVAAGDGAGHPVQ